MKAGKKHLLNVEWMWGYILNIREPRTQSLDLFSLKKKSVKNVNYNCTIQCIKQMVLVEKCNHYLDPELCQQPRRLTACTFPITSPPSPPKVTTFLMFMMIIFFAFLHNYTTMHTSLKNIVHFCLFLKYVHGTILYTFFCFWLLSLSIMVMRLNYVVVCSYSLFIPIAVEYSTVCMYLSRGHLSCF